MNFEKTLVARTATVSPRHTGFILFSIGLVVVGLKSIRDVITFSSNLGNTDSSHVLLIPFIAGALLYWKRAKIFSELRTSLWPAVVLFAVGMAVWIGAGLNAPVLGQSDYLALRTSGLIIAWLAGFFLFYGASAFGRALFPLIFLMLAVPIPSALFHGLARLLQHGSASMVSALFTLTGTPAYRDDVIFMLPGLTIEIAEECSGIRSTIGIFIITLLAGQLFLKSNWNRTILLLAVVPISLLKNAVRIAALSLLAIHWDMGFITGKLHHDGGVVFMMIGVGLLYPLLALLNKSEEKKLDNGVRL